MSLITPGEFSSSKRPVSAGGWTDDGSVVRLTAASDQVAVGSPTPHSTYRVTVVSDTMLALRAATGAPETWTFRRQAPANFGSADTLTVQPVVGGSGLQLHLIAQTGGQRLAVWDPSNALPNIPHTGIMPTLAVYGDILVGDIVALASNPMTYFIRANLNLAETAVTQLFSARAINNETDGGAGIILAPMKNAGGAVADGYVRVVAYGKGSAGFANEIVFSRRDAGSTSLVNSWAIGGSGIFYPKDDDGVLDIGTAGNRVGTLHAKFASITDGFVQMLHVTDAGGIATGTKYVGLWAGSVSEADAYTKILVPKACTLKNFYVGLGTAPGVGQSYTFTIRKNGVDTAVTVTISGAAGSGSDTTHSVALAAGDYFTIKEVGSAAPAASVPTFGFELA